MDGPTPTDQSRFAHFFLVGTRLILANPWTTVCVALGLAVVASIYSATRLTYHTNRLDLVNPNSEYNRHWAAYANEFGDKDDAVIVVEGRGREQIVPVIDDLAAALSREERQLLAVFARVDTTKLRSKGLYFLPAAQLQGIYRNLDEVAPVLAGDWSRLNAGRLSATALENAENAVRQAASRRGAKGSAGGVQQASGMMAPAGAANPLAALAPLERYYESLACALERRPFVSPWPMPDELLAQSSQLASQYMLSPDERFGFVTLKLATGADAFNKTAESGLVLRRIVAEARQRFPQVKIGLTGLPIMEDDEMNASQASMLLASVISMIGVAVLFIAGFGGIRHALLANAILIIGMAWSFAYATASVGHLNILSVTFTATLIGIGIDYGVYYCARYLQLRKECDTCEAALLETSRTAGPAIVTGAVTTSISFFAAGCTTFVGVAELGVIAGGGILLCALAELTVLPAAIYLVDRTSLGRRMPEPLAVHVWIQPMLRVPRLTLIAGVALTAVLAGGLNKLWYDNNLLNMQAVGLESVELERRLLDECHQSSWYALSIADTPEQLLALKAQYQTLPSVERTEEIVSLIPSDVAAKQPLVQAIGRRLEKIADHVPLIPVERPDRISQTLYRLSQILALAGPQTPCLSQIERIRAQLARGTVADTYALLSRFQQQAGDALLAQLRQLRDVADPQPPSIADLPPGLVSRFVGQHGKHLLRIYGRGNLWDTQALTQFVHDVRRVDPRVTGNPLQAHEASLEMRRSYQDAAMYSLLVIIAVLWLDFRSVQLALLAALPLGVGVLEAFGLMGWLQIPLNPANLIALPLILGIGVDYGVHIVHEFRDQHGPYRMSPGTAVAVLVDALTTIMGYGALMVASHQGLQSLGRVLTLGVTCCLFTSLVLLPALLTWTTRKRPIANAAEELLTLPVAESSAKPSAVAA
jgi:hopanoid biosynthesis associated RND transporter like protein HpnN